LTLRLSIDQITGPSLVLAMNHAGGGAPES